MSLLLLFRQPEVAPEVDTDRGGTSRRQPRTSVYASARARLPRPTSAATGRVSTPVVLAIEPVTAHVVAGVIAHRLACPASRAVGRRRTFATTARHRLTGQVSTSSATGSVWTQRDEEAELFLLGLFS